MAFENKYSVGVVNFGYSLKSRKWEFSFVTGGKSNTLLTEAPGGNSTAKKIAAQINGAISRSGKIDAMCRGSIKKLINSFLPKPVRKYGIVY